MADAVQVQALELQVRDNAEEAGKGLGALAMSLRRIKSLVEDGMKLGTAANQIGMFTQQINRIATQENVSAINRLSEAISSLAGSAKALNGTGSALKKVEQIAQNIGQNLSGSAAGGKASGAAAMTEEIRESNMAFREGTIESGKITETLADSSEKAKEAQGSILGMVEQLKEAGAAASEMDKSFRYMGKHQSEYAGKHAAYTGLHESYTGAHESMEAASEYVGKHVTDAVRVREMAERSCADALHGTAEGYREAAGAAETYTTEISEAQRNLGLMLNTADNMFTRGELTAKAFAHVSQEIRNIDWSEAGRGSGDTMDILDPFQRQSFILDLASEKMDRIVDKELEVAEGAKPIGDALEDSASKAEPLVTATGNVLTNATGAANAFNTVDIKSLAITQALTTAERAVEGIRSAMHRADDAIKSATNNFKRFSKAVFDARSGILGMLSGLMRMAKYRLFRSLIRNITEGFSEGLKNLREYSKAVDNLYHKDMAGLDNSLLKMKNSLGAMSGAAIQSLIPLFQRLTQWVITAANYINQFIALISGRTSWTRAIDVVADVEEETKKIGGSAKASAKEVKNLLASWDELNIIQSESGGGDGGGGAGAAKAAEEQQIMFEEVEEFDQKVRDMVTWLEEHMNVVYGIVGAMIAKMLGFTTWAITLALGVWFSFSNGLEAGGNGTDFMKGLTDNIEGFVLGALGGFLLGWQVSGTFGGAIAGLTLGLAVSLMAYEIGWLVGDYKTNGEESFLADAPDYIGNIVGAALGGAILGWTVFGAKGALIGLFVGASIGIFASILEWDKSQDEDNSMNTSSFLANLKRNITGTLTLGLAGLGIGFKITKSAQGALVGMGIGVSISLLLAAISWANENNADSPLSLESMKDDLLNIAGPAVVGGLNGVIIGTYAGNPVAGALIGVTIGALVGLALHNMTWDREKSIMKPETTFKNAMMNNMVAIASAAVGGGLLAGYMHFGIGGRLVGLTVGAFVGIAVVKMQYDAERTKALLGDTYGNVTLTDSEIKDLVGEYFTAGVDVYLEVTKAQLSTNETTKSKVTAALTKLKGNYRVGLGMGFDKTSAEYVEALKTDVDAVVGGLNEYLEGNKVMFQTMLGYSTTDEETGETLIKSVANIESLEGFIGGIGNDIGKILSDGVVDEFEKDTLQGLMDALNNITVAITTGKKAGEEIAKVQQLGEELSEGGWTKETWDKFTAQYEAMQEDLKKTAKEQAVTVKGQLLGMAYGMETANEEATKLGKELPYTLEEIEAAFDRAKAYDAAGEANKIYEYYAAEGRKMYEEFQKNIMGEFLDNGVMSGFMDVQGTAVASANDTINFGILEPLRFVRDWFDQLAPGRTKENLEYSIQNLDYTLKSLEKTALGFEKIEEVEERIAQGGKDANAWNILPEDAQNKIYQTYADAGFGVQFAQKVAYRYNDPRLLNKAYGIDQFAESASAFLSDEEKRELADQLFLYSLKGDHYALAEAFGYDKEIYELGLKGMFGDDFAKQLGHLMGLEIIELYGDKATAQEAYNRLLETMNGTPATPNGSGSRSGSSSGSSSGYVAPAPPAYEAGEEDGATETEQQTQTGIMRTIETLARQILNKEFTARVVPSATFGSVVNQSLNMYERTSG